MILGFPRAMYRSVQDKYVRTDLVQSVRMKKCVCKTGFCLQEYYTHGRKQSFSFLLVVVLIAIMQSAQSRLSRIFYRTQEIAGLSPDQLGRS